MLCRMVHPWAILRILKDSADMVLGMLVLLSWDWDWDSLGSMLEALGSMPSTGLSRHGGCLILFRR